jgi:hypothetical protein
MSLDLTADLQNSDFKDKIESSGDQETTGNHDSEKENLMHCEDMFPLRAELNQVLKEA